MKALHLKLCFVPLMLVGLSSCSLTSAQVRSGLLLTGRGVVEANRVCSHVAQELASSKPTEALAMAKTCTRVSNATLPRSKPANTRLMPPIRRRPCARYHRASKA